MVSPNYTQEKISSGKVDDWIDVYEDRTKGWFLEHAKNLLDFEHSGFAILQLTISYFENYAMYKNGKISKNTSADFFQEAFVDVFPYNANHHLSTSDLDKVATIIYQDARCGLFHDGMTRGRIILTNNTTAISVSFKPDRVVIDPAKFLDKIEQHFDRYIASIRDCTQPDKRNNFAAAFKKLNPF